MKLFLAFDNDFALLGVFTNEQNARTLAHEWDGFIEVIDTNKTPNENGQIETARIALD